MSDNHADNHERPAAMTRPANGSGPAAGGVERGDARRGDRNAATSPPSATPPLAAPPATPLNPAARPRRAGKPRRGATDLCGVIAIDKPANMTSHDVVDRLRLITGEGRIGHAGTLDPAATGLLLVCVGPATRLSNALMAGRKTYEARIVFGAATDTDDAAGAVIATAPLAPGLSSEDFARGVLARFVGEQQQMPPRVSAIKKDGRRAYELSRAGKEVTLEPRTVTVHALRLIAAAKGHWDIEAEVSKGTYIRSLARDIGEATGSKAHVASLRRTRSGAISLAHAHTLDELEGCDARRLRGCFLDVLADIGLAAEDIPESLLAGGLIGGRSATGSATGPVAESATEPAAGPVFGGGLPCPVM